MKLLGGALVGVAVGIVGPGGWPEALACMLMVFGILALAADD